MKNNELIIKKHFTKEALFYTQKGEDINLYFYNGEQTGFFNEYQMESLTYHTEKDFHILMRKSFFNYTNLQQVHLMNQIRQMLQNGSKSTFHKPSKLVSIISLISASLILFFVPSIFVSKHFASSHILIQISMFVLSSILAITPVILINFSDKVKSRKSVLETANYFMYIKDEDYKKKRKEYKESNKLTRRQMNTETVFGNPFNSFFRDKSWLIGLYPFIAFIFTITAIGIPIEDTLDIYEYILEIGYVSFHETDLHLIEENPTTGYFYECGIYYCDTEIWVGENIYTQNFEEIDLYEIINADEEDTVIYLSLKGNHALLLQNISDDVPIKYYVVNIETKEIILETDDHHISEDTDFDMRDFEIIDNELFILGYVSKDRQNKSYIFHENDLTTNLLTTSNFRSRQMLYFDENLYLVVDDGPNPVVYEIDNLNINGINIEEETSYDLPVSIVPRLHIAYNNLYVTINVEGENFFDINTTKLFDIETSTIYDIPSSFMVFNESHIIGGVSVIDYFEIDEDYNLLREGLPCRDCSENERFGSISYYKKDGLLYINTNERQLIYEYKDSYIYMKPGMDEPYIMIYLFVLPFYITLIRGYISKTKFNKLQDEIQDLSNRINQ